MGCTQSKQKSPQKKPFKDFYSYQNQLDSNQAYPNQRDFSEFLDQDSLHKILENFEEFKQKCQGCLYGGMLGDAIGATLEFMPNPSSEKVELALEVTGNGIHKLSPGQITDDGEMMLHLSYALLKIIERENFSADLIAEEYYQWFKSPPFDIGNTVGGPLLAVDQEIKTGYLKQTQLAEQMTHFSNIYNSKSESNGTVMRVAPLAIFGSVFDNKKFNQFVQLDVGLTHSSQLIKDATFFHCLFVQYLLVMQGYNGYDAYLKARNQFFKLKHNSKLIRWIQEAEIHYQSQKLINSENSGHLRIAFVNSIVLVLNSSNYESGIRKMLELGGDTDTNCAIVGSLIGAGLSVEGIPSQQLDILLRFDPSKDYKKYRPMDYAPRNINKFLEAFFEKIKSFQVKSAYNLDSSRIGQPNQNENRFNSAKFDKSINQSHQQVTREFSETKKMDLIMTKKFEQKFREIKKLVHEHHNGEQILGIFTAFFIFDLVKNNSRQNLEFLDSKYILKTVYALLQFESLTFLQNSEIAQESEKEQVFAINYLLFKLNSLKLTDTMRAQSNQTSENAFRKFQIELMTNISNNNLEIFGNYQNQGSELQCYQKINLYFRKYVKLNSNPWEFINDLIDERIKFENKNDMVSIGTFIFTLNFCMSLGGQKVKNILESKWIRNFPENSIFLQQQPHEVQNYGYSQNQLRDTKIDDQQYYQQQEYQNSNFKINQGKSSWN